MRPASSSRSSTFVIAPVVTISVDARSPGDRGVSPPSRRFVSTCQSRQVIPCVSSVSLDCRISRRLITEMRSLIAFRPADRPSRRRASLPGVRGVGRCGRARPPSPHVNLLDLKKLDIKRNMVVAELLGRPRLGRRRTSSPYGAGRDRANELVRAGSAKPGLHPERDQRADRRARARRRRAADQPCPRLTLRAADGGGGDPARPRDRRDERARTRARPPQRRAGGDTAAAVRLAAPRSLAPLLPPMLALLRREAPSVQVLVRELEEDRERHRARPSRDAPLPDDRDAARRGAPRRDARRDRPVRPRRARAARRGCRPRPTSTRSPGCRSPRPRPAARRNRWTTCSRARACIRRSCSAPTTRRR